MFKRNIAKVILNKINKSYLILDPPRIGKTSLLRAIASLISKKKLEGYITDN